MCWNSWTIIASNLKLKREKRKGPAVYNSMVITGYKIALRKQNTAKTMWKISTSNTSSFHTKTAKKVNNHNEFRGNSYTVIINNYTNTHYIELLCRNETNKALSVSLMLTSISVLERDIARSKILLQGRKATPQLTA